MSDKIFLNSIFGYREDTLEKWENHNPILMRGEPGIVRDGVDGRWLKIGDGISTWKELPWKLGPEGEKGEQGIQGVKGDKGEAGVKGDKGEDGAGRIAPDGSSVVFNDYEGNSAGTKAFRIQSGSGTVGGTGRYTFRQDDGIVNELSKLSDALVESGSAGLSYSLWLYNHTSPESEDMLDARWNDLGKILSVDLKNSSVTVSNYIVYDYAENTGAQFHENSFFKISGRPDLGTEIIEECAFVGGSENKAIGSGSAVFGKQNVANDAQSLVFGKGNYANYAAMAGGADNHAIGQRSNASVGQHNWAVANDSDIGGDSCQSRIDAVNAFARGRSLRAIAPNQTVLGQYNKEEYEAKFIVGVGANNEDRKNGFVVYDDGSVDIKGKISANGVNLNDGVEDALSPIVRVDNLPSKGRENKIYCVPAKSVSASRSYDKYLWLNRGGHYDALYSEEKVWNGSLSAPSGAEENTYLISTASELAYIIRNGGGSHYKLTNDIYLNNPDAMNWLTGEINEGYTVNEWYHSETTTGYVPMKSGTVIDGNGFVVHGVYRNSGDTTGGEDGCALIPRIASGATVTIKNLGIDNTYINIGSQAGGFVAVANCQKIAFENCFVGENVSVSGQYTGVFVAYGGGTITLTDCYSLNGCDRYLVDDTWGTKHFARCYVVNGAITKKPPTSVTECYATEGDYGNVITVDKMQGSNALENMALGEEYQTTDGFPMLKVFAYGWERL